MPAKRNRYPGLVWKPEARWGRKAGFKIKNPLRGQVITEGPNQGKIEPPQVWVWVPDEHCGCKSDAGNWMLRYRSEGKAPRRIVASRELFFQYFRRVLNEDGSIKRRTKEHYLSRLNSPHIVPLHNYQVSKITALDIEYAVMRSLLKRDEFGKVILTGNTINGYLASLSRIFTYAVEVDEIMPENPVAGVSRRGIPKAVSRLDVKVLEREDLRYIIDGVERRFGTDRYEIVFAIAFYTGARVSEILGLRCGDIDIEERTIHFLMQPANGRVDASLIPGLKTERESVTGRVVDFGPELIPYLKRQTHRLGINRRDNDRFIPGVTKGRVATVLAEWRDGKTNREQIGPPEREYDGSDGTPPLTMHKFRHSYISHLIDSGAPMGYVCAQSGDTEAMLVKRYKHKLRRNEARRQQYRQYLELAFGDKREDQSNTHN